MGKIGGDLPNQGTLEIVERIAPSHELVKRFLRMVGVPDYERIAGLLKKAGVSLAPVDGPLTRRSAAPIIHARNSAPEFSPKDQKPAPGSERVFAAEGALFSWRGFIALPVRIFSSSRGEQPWRPVRAFFFGPHVTTSVVGFSAARWWQPVFPQTPT